MFQTERDLRLQGMFDGVMDVVNGKEYAEALTSLATAMGYLSHMSGASHLIVMNMVDHAFKEAGKDPMFDKVDSPPNFKQ